MVCKPTYHQTDIFCERSDLAYFSTSSASCRETTWGTQGMQDTQGNSSITSDQAFFVELQVPVTTMITLVHPME